MSCYLAFFWTLRCSLLIFHGSGAVNIPVKQSFQYIHPVRASKITGGFVPSSNVRTLHSVLIYFCSTNTEYGAL